MIDFSKVMRICGADALKAGWWNDFPGSLEDVKLGAPITPEQHMWLSTKLLLVVSEVSEAHDEIRNGKGIDEVYYTAPSAKPEGFLTELADVVIRVMDLCANLDLPLEDMVHAKLEYNRTRGHKHGGKVS